MKKTHKIIIIVLLLVAFISIVLGIVYSKRVFHNEKEKESFEDYLSHCGMSIYTSDQYLDYITEDNRYFLSLNILSKSFHCDISDYKEEWSYCDLDRSGIYISPNDSFPISIALNGCVFPKK